MCIRDRTSTRGFLGRILDFIGVLFIGWMVSTLPALIKGITSFLSKAGNMLNALRNFTGGLTDAFTQSNEELEETEEETNDDFENLYKGQISKSGVAILPSKRTRRIPEVKKPSLADEALSELKAEQPEIKEENLDKEEAPLELSEEAPVEEENKTE